MYFLALQKKTNGSVKHDLLVEIFEQCHLFSKKKKKKNHRIAAAADVPRSLWSEEGAFKDPQQKVSNLYGYWLDTISFLYNLK